MTLEAINVDSYRWTFGSARQRSRVRAVLRAFQMLKTAATHRGFLGLCSIRSSTFQNGLVYFLLERKALFRKQTVKL